jgi:hypothetical protein
MDNFTYGLDILEDKIEIESWIRTLAKYPNTFTIGFFDCCRVKVKPKS